MADPKIRYDILANAEGEDDVRRLASELAKLDDSIDPAAAEKARQLGATIQELGQKTEALQTFRTLKLESEAAAKALAEAQSEAQAWAQVVAALDDPTKAEIGQLERLRDAVKAAKEEFQNSSRAMEQARADLTELGVSTTELASADIALRNSLKTTKAEIAQLATSHQAAARAADESRAATARLVTESQAAGRVLESAFAQTGVRSLQAIEAEIIGVESSVSVLQRRFEAGAISAADLSRAVAAAGLKIQALKSEIASVPALPGQFEAMGARLNDLVGKFGALTAAIATVGAAAKPVLDATAALESLRRVLTTVSGDADKAEQQIAFLRQTAQKSGLAFAELGDAYGKFAASASQSGLSIQQIENVFSAVALAAGNLGLSTDKAQNALNALGQMASKGTVQMEELRGQLGEALPGVLPLLARQLGLTQTELAKVVESGQLLASEALPAIGKALSSLAPSNGVVDGMVASWNRFVNVVKEAGTVVAEGPLGSAAGVVVAAFAGVVRDLSVVVVGASEAFKLFGLSTLAVLDALRGNTSFKELKTQISDFAEQAGERLNKFKDTAYGTGRNVDALGKNLDGLGTSFARLSLEQQKSIDAAELLAQTSAKSVEARRAEGASINTLASLLGDEAKKLSAAADAAVGLFEASKRQAAANDAVVAALVRARDATLAKAAAEGTNQDAIKATIEALNEKIAKATADAEKTHAQADAARASAAAMDLAAEAAGDNSKRIEELKRAVEAAELAHTSQVRALRLDATTQDDARGAAIELAKAKGLLRDAVDDVAKALEREIAALRANAELASAGIELELERAKLAQARAQERGDETAAIEAGNKVRQLQQQLDKESIGLKLQEASVRLRALDTQERELKSLGQLTPERQAEIETQRKGALASVLQAEAQRVATQAKVESQGATQQARTATEGHSGAVARNTELLGTNSGGLASNTDAKNRNAEATKKATTAEEKWQELLDAVNPRSVSGSGLAGISGQVGTTPITGVRDAGGPANVVNGLKRIDSYGDLIRNTPSGGVTRTLGGQLRPPDNSGKWALTEAGIAYAQRNPNAISIPNEYWFRTDQAELEAAFAAQQTSMGLVQDQYGLWRRAPAASAPEASAPAQATSPSNATGSYMVNVTIGGRTVGIGAASKLDADRMIEQLEAAFRAGGG